MLLYNILLKSSWKLFGYTLISHRYLAVPHVKKSTGFMLKNSKTNKKNNQIIKKNILNAKT